jgi:hypothetical protein
MPVDTEVCTKVWNRYAWARDNGHHDFVEKADKCESFFAGNQWDPADLFRLRAARRPALTINKIISTLSNVFGEQIYNRSEITFRPRGAAAESTADILSKVFKYVSDNNQLDWKRSDMFADGSITGRGFLDMRIDFNESMQGDIVIDTLNPKNVIIDPDGEQADPDTWGEVFTTKWVTADDIAVLYSKEDAEILRNKDGSFFPYGYDSIEARRDRFGNRLGSFYNGTYDESSVMRCIRLIERQYRMLDKQKHFIVPATGETRPVPEDFTRDRIAWFVEKFGFQVITKLVRRIRWTAIADNVKLHDDWSPYKRFTVIPYFPYFRHGNTIGLVENLLGSQELLNKTSSQELHVVNTTANSGWKVKTGALTNMTIEELEERGAETGLVLEINADGALSDAVEKITPNTVPTGLDRITYKAEEHIKSISGVSDSMQGFDREDVAAKAIQEKKKSGSTNLAKPLDSLQRTDYFIARHFIDLVQEYFTEERILTITKDQVSGDTETFVINQVNDAGEVLNDLTLGEYQVVVGSAPQRETLEDSQFEQATALREMGVPIPDEVLIENSRLRNKKQIIEKMRAAASTPEAQAQAELAMRGQAAEVAKVESEGQNKQADTKLKLAKAEKESIEAQKEAVTPPEDNGIQVKMMEAEADIDINERKFQHEVSMDERKLEHELKIKTLEAQQDAKLKEEQAATERAVRVSQAANAAANPTQPTKGAKPKQGQTA